MHPWLDGLPSFLPYDKSNNGRDYYPVREQNRPHVPIHWHERRGKEGEQLVTFAEFAEAHENSEQDSEITIKLAFCAMPYVDERTYEERQSQLDEQSKQR